MLFRWPVDQCMIQATGGSGGNHDGGAAVNLANLLGSSASRVPDRQALTWRDRWISYRELLPRRWITIEGLSRNGHGEVLEGSLPAQLTMPQRPRP